MINKFLIGTALAFILITIGLIAYDADYADAQGLSILKASQGGTGIGSTTVANVGKCLQVLDESPFTYTFGDCSGGSGGSATTTINGVTGPTFSFATGTATGIGLTIATSSGTLTFTPTVSSGYSIPLTASTTNWNTAYGWGDHSLAGYLTGVAWGSITGTLSNQTDLQTALNAKQDTLTTGNLTESVTGLQFDATRSVIGGAAALSLSAGYTIPLSASTTEWSTAYASTTALTPAYIRGLFSGTSPVSYNSGTGAFGITADAIGDTQLAFNTGQHLTTTSAPTFASSTFSNLTSAVLLTTAGGLLQEYAGTACTNQFVRSLSALASATCAAVSLTADVTGILPIANGGTGETTATAAFSALSPLSTKGDLLTVNAVGNQTRVPVGSDGNVLMASSSASNGIAWTATSSLGITASAGGSNTQLQYNSGGALAGLSTLTTDGASITMTGTSTLATTTITNLNAGGASLVVTPGNATFGGDVFGAGMCDGTGANCFTLNSGFINFGIGAGDYIQFNGSENNADTYFSTDNGTYTLFVDGGTDRVGIGTSTPAQLLTVAGTLGVTGTSTLASTTATRLGVGTTTIAGGTQILTVDGSALFTGETTLGQNLYVTDNIGMTTNNAYLYWGDGSTLIGGNSSTDVLSFYTAGTENLTVYSNGNVGIGTTTPGVKLTVIGGIWANATSTFATTTITNLLGMTSIDSTSITTIENAFDTVSAALETAIEAALDTLTNLTNVAVSTVLQIPNGTGPTANDPGEIAHDTSDNQLILDDYVVGKATDTIFKVTVASTSPAFTNSGLLKVPTELDGFTITAIRCSVETGTSKVVAIEDASGNSSEDITCGTSVTSDDGSITNATYTAGEELYVDFGATSGSVDYVSISVFGTWSRE